MAKREDGFEAEIKDARYEIHIFKSRRADLLQALERLGPTAPVHEQERLREQIAACDVKLLISENRFKYLERRETEDLKAEDLELRPSMKKKFKP